MTKNSSSLLLACCIFAALIITESKPLDVWRRSAMPKHYMDFSDPLGPRQCSIYYVPIGPSWYHAVGIKKICSIPWAVSSTMKTLLKNTHIKNLLGGGGSKNFGNPMPAMEY